MLQPIPDLLHGLPKQVTRNETWKSDYLIGSLILTISSLLLFAPLPWVLPRVLALMAASPALLYLCGYLYDVTRAILCGNDALPTIRGSDHRARAKRGLTYAAVFGLYSPPVLLYGMFVVVAAAIFDAINIVLAGLLVGVPLLLLSIPFVLLPVYMLPLAVANAVHMEAATAGLQIRKLFAISHTDSYITTVVAVLGLLLVAALLGVLAVVVPLVGIPLMVLTAFGVLVVLHVMFAEEFLKHRDSGDRPVPAE